MTAKVKFIIVGSGWRSLYYVRIAKAHPELFQLCAMLCRTEEKALKMTQENNIYATTSEEECVKMQPNVVVVAVNKDSIADVSMHWMEKGFCVLSETPAAMKLENLNKLWEMHQKGHKIVVNEQYTHYPTYQVLLYIAELGILGSRDCLNVSLAHEYHGVSLTRALLGLKIDQQFTLTAKEYKFLTTETLTRYDHFTDGRTAPKKRTIATFEFENGKIALYDFDSEQYRSPIRKNTVKLQGVRGEIINWDVYYLDQNNNAVMSPITFTTRTIYTNSTNPNLCQYEEVTSATFQGQNIYTPKITGLAEDETAMAEMLLGTALYAKGLAEPPYPLEAALQDAYSMLLMQKAIATGTPQHSEKQVWNG